MIYLIDYISYNYRLGCVAACGAEVLFYGSELWFEHIENAQAFMKVLTEYLTHKHIIDTALKRIAETNAKMSPQQEDKNDDDSSAVARPINLKRSPH